MKSSDIAMLIVIITVSAGIAFGVVSAIPGLKHDGKPEEVYTITEYSSSLSDPDPSIFNKEAINPTIDVTIGDKS